MLDATLRCAQHLLVKPFGYSPVAVSESPSLAEHKDQARVWAEIFQTERSLIPLVKYFADSDF